MVSGLHYLNIVIPELLQAGAIIAKLLTKWNDYRKKLLHMTRVLVGKLLSHIRTEEENRKRDAEYFSSKSDGNLVSNSVGQSSQG